MSPKRRVILAMGTRPEAIKLGPVYQSLESLPDIDPLVLVTGQHREQLEHGLGLFEMEPAANLDVMVDRQTLPATASRIIGPAAEALASLRAEYLVVQGDTLSTFCVAWAAFLEGLPVAHVEAGLRSNDLSQPFPEEANRQMTDVLAELLLPPTSQAKNNLLKEGVDGSSVLVTGQTGIDAVLHASKISDPPGGIPGGPVVTITLHRRENWPILRSLATSLSALAQRCDDFTFVYPVHLNPVVRQAVWEPLAHVDNVVLMEPLEYGPMSALLSRSQLAITDSGGIQEEAAALGVPTLVVRNVTERPEGILSGHLLLAGTDPDRVLELATTLLKDPQERDRMRSGVNPYGDGLASDRVARAVAWRLGLAERPDEWTTPVRQAPGMG